MNTQNSNSIFDEALRRHDEGMSVSDILKEYPQERAELTAFFGVIEKITVGVNSMPRREVLMEALAQSEKLVTKKKSMSYREGTDRGNGRASRFSELVHETEHMLNKMKFIIPVGVVALLVIIFVGSRLGTSQNTSMSLNDFTDSETELIAFNSTIDALSDESEFDVALAEAASDPGTGDISSDAFSGIEQESQDANFDAEFDAYFDEESSLDDAFDTSLDSL